MNSRIIRKKIAKLLIEQKLGILATSGKKYPYQSIVAFSASRDMKYILFATKRATSKYKNLEDRNQVSIFIDNRSNQEADFIDATGMTVLGDAQELNGADARKHMKTFTRKHPSLRHFLSDVDCALFRIRVRVYYVVVKFQEVTEFRMI